MPIVVQEGLEIDSLDIPERSGQIVRLGPLNVSIELREIIEAMAEEENRSISNTARLLLERGLKYTEEMYARKRRR